MLEALQGNKSPEEMQIPAVERGGKAGSGIFQVTTGMSLLSRGTSVPEGLKVPSLQPVDPGKDKFSITEIPLDPRESLQLINFPFH